MDEKGLGQRLQAARLSAGLTQQQLCQQAGLSYSTLTKIERGAIKSPSIFTIQSIAAVIGVSLEDLLGVPHVGRNGHAAFSPTQRRLLKRSKSGITFVFFDVGDCLIRPTHKAFGQLAEESGQTPDTVETLFWHYNDQVCRGDMSVADFNATLAQELKLPKVDWLVYCLDSVEPVVEMAELVRWAAEHYRVGLLSNSMSGFIDALMQHKLLPDISYDVVVDSSRVGTIKPEAKIFELATQTAACSASEILFIDDSRTNLLAAEKLGWHVMQCDAYQPEETAQKVRHALAF